MNEERFFTSKELLRYDGDDHPSYIAYNGVVYDVSACPRWMSGIHERLHFPGQDLSSELVDAPHGEDVFERPCIKRVGRLVANSPAHSSHA